MPKTYTITVGNSNDLRRAMKEKSKRRFYARLQSVALRGEGNDNDEIGAITGYHPAYVSQLVSIYCREGIAGLCKEGRRGGNNRNMTDEEEKAFLAGFEEAAKRGQVTTVAEIAAAYDEATGKEHKSKSTVYSLLHKHGWRMTTPQTAHPGKASEEAIEASKKSTSNLRKRDAIFYRSLRRTRKSESCLKTKRALGESANQQTVGRQAVLDRLFVVIMFVSTNMLTERLIP